MEIYNNIQTAFTPTQNLENSNSTEATEKQSTLTDSQKQTQQIEKQQENQDKNEIKQEIIELTEKLNEEINPLNTSLEFGYEETIEELSVSVIDKNTDKVIRKFPSDEAIKLMEKMRELTGMLFDKKG